MATTEKTGDGDSIVVNRFRWMQRLNEMTNANHFKCRCRWMYFASPLCLDKRATSNLSKRKIRHLLYEDVMWNAARCHYAMPPVHSFRLRSFRWAKSTFLRQFVVFFSSFSIFRWHNMIWFIEIFWIKIKNDKKWIWCDFLLLIRQTESPIMQTNRNRVLWDDTSQMNRWMMIKYIE